MVVFQSKDKSAIFFPVIFSFLILLPGLNKDTN